MLGPNYRLILGLTFQNRTISTLRKYMHSSCVCINSHILNETDAKIKKSACLLIYNITVLAQRCLLSISIVFSSLVTESWDDNITRQSQRLVQVWNLWTKFLFLAAISVNTSKHLSTHPAGRQNNCYVTLNEIFILLFRGHNRLS